jgi:hypothetical protein
MQLYTRYVGDFGSQVQYTKLLHSTLCTLFWGRWKSSSVNNAVSCDFVHVMLETLVINFSIQRCFIRLCVRYGDDLGNQVQYATLLHTKLCTLCW